MVQQVLTSEQKLIHKVQYKNKGCKVLENHKTKLTSMRGKHVSGHSPNE
jgi:hypothetical protein